jgi:hypothetical protein
MMLGRLCLSQRPRARANGVSSITSHNQTIRSNLRRRMDCSEFRAVAESWTRTTGCAAFRPNCHQRAIAAGRSETARRSRNPRPCTARGHCRMLAAGGAVEQTGWRAAHHGGHRRVRLRSCASCAVYCTVHTGLWRPGVFAGFQAGVAIFMQSRRAFRGALNRTNAATRHTCAQATPAQCKVYPRRITNTHVYTRLSHVAAHPERAFLCAKRAMRLLSCSHEAAFFSARMC